MSVNGFTGAVSLTTSNISEGSNLYYTDVRARTSISGSTGISYNSTTGVITNSAPDQTVSLTASTGISTSGTYPSFTITNTAPDQTVALTSGTGISATGTYPNFTITNTAPDQVVALTQGGTTTISGTYPNFTISSADQYVGTVTSVGITESSAALSITGSPVTTSGNINIGFAGSPTQYVAGDGSLVTFPTIITQAQNLVAEVYNNTGATLTKGTIVYINGGHGNLPTVTKALATSDPTSAQTFGFINVDLTNNNNGYVTIIGRLDNIDTQAYANGTQLYLSGVTAGTYTSTKPQAPIHLVYVAIVVRSHPTQGVLEVKIQNGVEMDEIHDVQITSIANGNILQYDSTTSLWKNVAGTTTNIAEGTNLYYTDTRSRTSISTTATGLTYTSGTGVLSLTAGYVIPTTTSATEWDTAYTNRITSATSPLSITSNVISIPQATTSVNGYLSSTDWTTFNSKQGTITLTTTGSSGASTLVSNTLNIPTYTLTGLGGVPTTRTLTINGTGYDLSADRSWTIPTSVNATFTQDYTATAAQTTFTVTGGYTVGQLAVYYNGSKLASAEFTATNGTTFVLATACQVNDIVQAVAEITGGGIGGSGTTNYISKWTASGVLGDSAITDNGTTVTLVSRALAGTSATFSGAVTLATSSGVLAVNTTGRPAGVGGGDNGKIWSKQATTGNYGIATIASATDSFTYIGHNGTDALLGTSYGTTGAYTDLVLQTADTTRFRLSGSTGAATFSSSVNLGGYLTGQGTNPGGLGGSRYVIDWLSGSMRIFSYGADASTNGGFVFNSQRSDGTNSFNPMTITSAGNVGIGTDTPTDGKLVIAQSAVAATYKTDIALVSTNSVGTNSHGIDWFDRGIGGDNSGRISVIRESSSAVYAMAFYTANASFVATERMRITSGGQVIINGAPAADWAEVIYGNTATSQSYGLFVKAGTNSTDTPFLIQNTSGTTVLRVRGDGVLFSPPTWTNAYASTANVIVGTDGSFGRNTSSLKYKKNVENYTRGLSDVLKLRAVLYESKNPSEEGMPFTGFIAEEVEELGFTEFVEYAEDGTPDALRYPHFTALLVKAIQEQQAQIQELKAEIDELKNK